MKKKQKKKYRLKVKRLFILILFLILLFFTIKYLINKPISNILIKGNHVLKDQEIIEYLNLENYPSILKYSKKNLANKLEKHIFIKDAEIQKKGSKLVITVEENYPLFYDINKKTTILSDKRTDEYIFDTPVLINYVPEKIYEELLVELNILNKNILNRISEIEYKPNDVDEKIFLLKMTDDNYVYITIGKFKSLNKYVDIVSNFVNKKGILYLDSGEYFKIIDNN